ncbi:hypothetical protein GcM1_215048 [Golovinomyces cichoracearum]|uniref:Uncharacterized protein n=1 Tax=Golovinomyces cichoracearum TaxID=62708 RepID=A0A420ITT1_9PEZI|nr:hypothetical protein GcM1_215048 [Golovinomyces cichoracearum]
MTGTSIRGVTYADVEINGFTQKMYFYVIPMLEHPVILGKPWMIHNRAYPILHLKVVRHGRSKMDVPTSAHVKKSQIIKEIRTVLLLNGFDFVKLLRELKNHAFEIIESTRKDG